MLWLAVYEVIGIIKTLQRLQTEYWLQLKRVKLLFEWILDHYLRFCSHRGDDYAIWGISNGQTIQRWKLKREFIRLYLWKIYACSIMDSSSCFIYYILYVGFVLPKIIDRKVVDILFGTLIHPQITPQHSHCQNFWSVTYELVWAPLM